MDLQKKFEKKMEHLSVKFCFPSPVAVAVSGGADSMCLTLLLLHWFEKKGWGKENIHPVIVNHQLRKNASEEAQQVIQILQDYFNITGEILVWKTTKITTCIQEKARNARYQLLSEYCRKKKISYLFTAHHGDDQIETFLMRAQQKSGVKGLSGIPEVRSSSFGYIIRPLLNIQKKALVETLKLSGVKWVEDPSNKSDVYQRNRWRKRVSILEKQGVNIQTILDRIKNLKQANERLDSSVEKFLKKYLIREKYGWWKLHYPLWSLDFELFKRIIKQVSYLYEPVESYPPRGREYRHNYLKLGQGEAITFRELYFLPKKGSLYIFREIAFCQHIDLKSNNLLNNYIWDKRFIIDVKDFHGKNGTIGPLTEKGWQKLRKEEKDLLKRGKKNKMPGPALFSLPAFWSSDSDFPQLIWPITLS